MRFDEAGLDADQVRNLLVEALRMGIDTAHCSSEYSSFPMFAAAARALADDIGTGDGPAAFRHIVKIAEPHYGDREFEPARFRAKFEHYRESLGTQRIELVQLMIRAELSDHDERREILCRDAPLIGAIINELRDSGALGGLVMFPYHSDDIMDGLEYDWCDGFSIYLNPLELDAAALDRIYAADRGVVAIRPMAAGRLLQPLEAGGLESGANGDRAAECLRFALLHPVVATTVVSTSSSVHLAELARAASVETSMEAFKAQVASVHRRFGAAPSI